MSNDFYVDEDDLLDEPISSLSLIDIALLRIHGCILVLVFFHGYIDNKKDQDDWSFLIG